MKKKLLLSLFLLCSAIGIQAQTKMVISKDASGVYSTTLRGLEGNTVYYYRPYAEMDGTVFYGQVSSFKTSEDNVVETGDADAAGNVKSKLTIGGGAYSKLELGVCWSATNEVPTISDNTVTTNEVDDENCYTLRPEWYVGTTYYYRSFVKIDGTAHYGAVKTFTLDATVVSVGNAVDLGLSVKWADMNVGATSPEGYGFYYAWGEVEPKATYYWDTYFDSVNGSSSNFNKYATNKKTTLDPEDDVAHVKWGGDWRMPTKAEQDELREKCTWTWTIQGNVNGYKVVGPNGNSIFLPAAGCRLISSLRNAGSVGLYWSSSLNESYSNDACSLFFLSGGVGWDGGYRYVGLSVRAVCP